MAAATATLTTRRRRRHRRDSDVSDDASVPVAQSISLSIEKDGTVPGGTANVVGEVMS